MPYQEHYNKQLVELATLDEIVMAVAVAACVEVVVVAVAHVEVVSVARVEAVVARVEVVTVDGSYNYLGPFLDTELNSSSDVELLDSTPEELDNTVLVVVACFDYTLLNLCFDIPRLD